MKNRLIESVINNENKLPYINLNDDNSYKGWTSNFNIILPNNQKMYLNLEIESDLFLLFVLASSWSKTGPWENAAYFTTYLKYNKKDNINLWIDDEFIQNEINNRAVHAKSTVTICDGIIPRKKVSFRKDYYSSVAVLARNWEMIKSNLQNSSDIGDYLAFIKFINSIEGLGAGNNKMRIKILLILRELRCQKIYDNIPGELCCVPDERVLSSAERLNIKLPRISSINNMLKASEIIYNNFGDLYDVPLFAFEDIKHQIII